MSNVMHTCIYIVAFPNLLHMVHRQVCTTYVPQLVDFLSIKCQVNQQMTQNRIEERQVALSPSIQQELSHIWPVWRLVDSAYLYTDPNSNLDLHVHFHCIRTSFIQM